MVRPCVARGLLDLADVVLHQCIRPLVGARAPGHHGYQRACDLITGQASVGHLGHQCSHVPDPRTGEVLEKIEMPRGVAVSGLESNGSDQFFCGGGSSGKVRAVRRPKRRSA
jgi:hypothetical protein